MSMQEAWPTTAQVNVLPLAGSPSTWQLCQVPCKTRLLLLGGSGFTALHTANTYRNKIKNPSKLDITSVPSRKLWREPAVLQGDCRETDEKRGH